VEDWLLGARDEAVADGQPAIMHYKCKIAQTDSMHGVWAGLKEGLSDFGLTQPYISSRIFLLTFAKTISENKAESHSVRS
jgi:hypothetical protein